MCQQQPCEVGSIYGCGEICPWYCVGLPPWGLVSKFYAIGSPEVSPPVSSDVCAHVDHVYVLGRVVLFFSSL